MITLPTPVGIGAAWTPHPIPPPLTGRHWTSLCLQDAEGFPRVERDLVQVEQLSQKLRAKAARADHSEEAFAATRLLAQEGLNNRKCVPSADRLERAHWPCSRHAG